MKMLISLLIISWNKLLAIPARAVGLFFGGLYVGFLKGIKDQREMSQYLKYQAHMVQKEIKDDSKNGE